MGNYLCLPFVVLCIKDLVGHSHLLEHFRKLFRVFNARCSHKDRTALPVELLDLLGGCPKLFLNGPEDNIWMVFTDHRLVGWNYHHVQIVNLLELCRLRVCSTCHTCKFLIHAEKILKGNGGKGLVLAFNLYALFRLKGLVKPVAVPPSWHDPAGKLVNDNYLAIFYDVIHVLFEEFMGL